MIRLAAAGLSLPGLSTVTSAAAASKPSSVNNRAAAPLLTRGRDTLDAIAIARFCSHVAGYPLTTRTPRSGSVSQPRCLARRISRDVNPKEAAWLRTTTPWREAANSAMARGAEADMWRNLSTEAVPPTSALEVRNFVTHTARSSYALRAGSGGVGQAAWIREASCTSLHWSMSCEVRISEPSDVRVSRLVLA